METVKDFLWPIAAIGGLGAFGAFIDFLIGKVGQAKAKDFLLKWWVRFDDIHWKNFGREEGLFAGKIIEEWLGRRIFSPRRVASAVILFSAFLLIGYFKYMLTSNPLDAKCLYCSAKLYIIAVVLITYFLGFSVSCSFTKYIAFRIAYLCGVHQAKNFSLFMSMLIVSYLMLLFWLPTISGIRVLLVNLFVLFVPFNQMSDPISALYSFASEERFGLNYLFFGKGFDVLYPKYVIGVVAMEKPIVLSCLPVFPSFFRFVLSGIFVGSFLLKPLLMRPVSLVWTRIVESEKPVFTLIFGGVAAFGSAINEAAKLL